MYARSLGVDDLEIARAAADAKVSAALEEGEKSEIRVIQARYYGVVSARVTCYSIGSEACALLAGLSQPVIGVDRSSDSEVFRVTRGIGQGCSTRFVAFPVAFQISRFRSQNYCGKTTRSRRWRRRRRRSRARCRCRSGSRGRRRRCRWNRGRRRCCRWSRGSARRCSRSRWRGCGWRRARVCSWSHHEVRVAAGCQGERVNCPRRDERREISR